MQNVPLFIACSPFVRNIFKSAWVSPTRGNKYDFHIIQTKVQTEGNALCPNKNSSSNIPL